MRRKGVREHANIPVQPVLNERERKTKSQLTGRTGRREEGLGTRAAHHRGWTSQTPHLAVPYGPVVV